MKKLYEKKDHLIRKNPNLTSKQKSDIIELLGRHPSYENKIDWNKSSSLTYEDFLEVLRPLYINELDPRGLIEGEDYDILYESDDEVLYSVYTYEASKILASNNVEPKLWTKIPSWCGREEFTDEAHAFGHFDSEHGDMKPGAKWCISMQTSDKYWNEYSKDIHFLFWFRDDNILGDNRKIAIEVSKKTWEVAFLYNGADEVLDSFVPPYIEEIINNEKEDYKKRETNRIKNMFSLNPQTNRYDHDGDLDRSTLANFISEDGDGFTINFGKVTGEFDCSSLNLKSLKGAPTEVGENFYCAWNDLTSLEGAPQKVGGYFNCSENNLTSLEGAPQEINKRFDCSDNQLTSLKGAPQKVGGIFDCSRNKLTSLEGAPQEVGKDFHCSSNQLTSLKGAPKIIGENFVCISNQLTSLVGAPQIIGGGFHCYYNQLISLEGLPKKIIRDLDCRFNQLTSLKGAPQEVGGFFDCRYNKLISLKGAPKEVGKDFDCSNNQITSLEGAPQIVGRDFDCSSNPNLHSLDGIGEVKGKIYKDF